MTRIVLDPEELATTSAELRGAAGEYQAIGARVVSCDCGCMPADVAAVVDAAAASIRSRLNSVSSSLTADSADLGVRAGVPQSGPSVAGSYQPSAISAASGGATVVVGGGFDTAVFGEGAADGYTLVVGGGFDTSVFGTGQAGGYTVSVGGGDWLSDTGGGYSVSVGGGDWLSDTGGGYSVSVGGGDWLSDTGGGYSFVIGGDFDPSVFDPGPGLGPGFNLTDWGLGGTGYGDRTPGSFTPTTYGESMALLVGMAAQNNDWFSMSMLQNIQASMNRTAGVWTLPSGWEYVYSPIW